MEGEIILEDPIGPLAAEDESRPFDPLEEAVKRLLNRHRETLKKNEELARALRLETERNDGLEQRLKVLSVDREKVKTRIDQLLLQLKVLDI
jgi:hypothetical protein